MDRLKATEPVLLEDDPDEAFFGGMDQCLDQAVWSAPEIVLGGIEGIDSDDEASDEEDELKPFAMADDSRNLNAKPAPVYLRDVIFGLRSKDDPEHFEASLRAAPALIASATDRLPEVAVDMAATLMHLGDDYALPGFKKLKQAALVGLMVGCPALVGRYELLVCARITHLSKPNVAEPLVAGILLLSFMSAIIR